MLWCLNFNVPHLSPRLPPVHRRCHCVPGAEVQSADSDLVVFSGRHRCGGWAARPRRLCRGDRLWQMHCQPHAQGKRGGRDNMCSNELVLSQFNLKSLDATQLHDNRSRLLFVTSPRLPFNSPRVSSMWRRKWLSWWQRKVNWRNRWKNWEGRWERVITRRRCQWRCRSKMLRRWEK